MMCINPLAISIILCVVLSSFRFLGGDLPQNNKSDEIKWHFDYVPILSLKKF